MRMNERDIRAFVIEKVKEMENPSYKDFEFICAEHHSGKWCLTLCVSGVGHISLKSQREELRLFANLDSAFKVANSILNSMTIIRSGGCCNALV